VRNGVKLLKIALGYAAVDTEDKKCDQPRQNIICRFAVIGFAFQGKLNTRAVGKSERVNHNKGCTIRIIDMGID
jgi:hypothetical protein